MAQGYENKSTICSYDWTKNETIDYTNGTHPPLWMERINPLYGIDILPVYIREQEPARDEKELEERSKLSNIQFKDRDSDHLYYDHQWDDWIVCDYSLGEQF